MSGIYTARVPDALCYQNHAEAFRAACDIKELTMLLEVRGYWIVLRRSALEESILAVDNVEAERLETLRLIEEAKKMLEPLADPVEEEAPAPAPRVKERKHG